MNDRLRHETGSVAVSEPHIVQTDLVSLLRRVYRQAQDDALGQRLGEFLILDADSLTQTITIDLDAANIPDNQAPGHVCSDCLCQTVDAREHWRGSGQRWAWAVLPVL